MPIKKTEGQELVELTVPIENHTHAGKDVKKGSKIKVDKETAAMLEKAWKEPEARD